MGDEPRPGVLATTWSVMLWPFRMVIGAVFTVLGFIMDTVERGFTFVGDQIKGVYLRGDPDREGAWRRKTGRVTFFGTYTLLSVMLVFMLFPFYWVIVTAFKTNEQMRTSESVFWPSPWTLQHFDFMLTKTDFPTWFGNTVQVAVVSCAISVLVGALGRLRAGPPAVGWLRHPLDRHPVHLPDADRDALHPPLPHLHRAKADRHARLPDDRLSRPSACRSPPGC